MNFTQYIKLHFKFRLFLCLFFSILSACFEMIGIASVGPFIQYLSTGNYILPFSLSFISSNEAIALGIFSISLLLTSGILSVANVMILYRVAFYLGKEASLFVFKSVLLARRSNSYLVDKAKFLRDLTTESNVRFVHNVFVSGIILCSRIFIVLLISAYLLSVNVKVTLIVLSLFAFVFSLIFISIKSNMSRFGRKISDTQLLMNSVISDSVDSLREIYLYDKNDKVVDIYYKQLTEHNNAQYSYNWLSQIPRYVIETIVFVSLVSFALFFYNAGLITDSFVGMLSLLAICGYRLMPSLQQVFLSITAIKANFISLTNISHYHLDNGIVKKEGFKVVDINQDSKPATFKNIVCKDVRFKYEGGNKYILNGINLDIKEGEKVAFIGESGSGKTTMLNLILGLYKATDGNIHFESDSSYNEIKKGFSLVSQDVFLLDMPLKENLSFFSRSENISSVSLNKALDVACCDFLAKDSSLSRTGLSGGQRQRVGIARAIVEDFNLLALDESTSALDFKIERELLRKLFQEYKDNTIIFIVHRLDILSRFDKIIAFENGNVEFSGSYDELLQNSKVFKKLRGE
ncbi:ATP-binding cassette domain-containing protein [Vibrio parahaemolyticus]|uniref:ATP-binding cassette domain-containing protein n=1 Tax=Vibrio parahaemolyticus TaxID=670 RepID=UPI000407D60B|nr:ABC transporter ATP-binding protein [Vibrio parahaemolyticus]